VHNVLVADFEFVALRLDDLPLLGSWLGRPHVARWWREPSDLAAVTRSYGPLATGRDHTEAFIVHLSDRPIGYVQRYLIDQHPDWRASIQSALGRSDGIGIDYLIGESELIGRGLGSQIICQFVATCWERYPSEGEVVVAVQQENRASWRALETSGFRRLWEGDIESSDPSDEGPSFIYVGRRGDD
jgi:aminoglycoside 6'-N-acetyltransferase